MKSIFTKNAPAPLGAYSQAIVDGSTVYVSGQLPIDIENPDKSIGSIEEQTTKTLENLEAVLIAAGSDRNHVLKTTIYITDLALWPLANAAYGAFFKDHKPARAAVPVTGLPKGYQIEIEAVAKVK